jgi:pSer/pThr/pTyr-binding forkhead associated (FHA) protein
MSMIDCPACGAQTPANSEFCDTCGHEFQELSPSASTPFSVESPPLSFASAPPPAPTPAPISTELPPPSSLPIPASPPISTELPPPSPAPVQANFQSNFSSSAPATTARLVAKQAGAPISEFNLEGSSLIGRFDSDTGPVDIDLEGFPGDDTISRNHAEIYDEGGQWKVKDLGSTNGVFIKAAGDTRFGTRITAPSPLNDGDEIAFGKIRLLFHSP